MVNIYGFFDVCVHCCCLRMPSKLF